MNSSFQQKLDELFDIARKPKGRYNEEKCNTFLNELMQSEGKQKPRGFGSTAGDRDDWTDDMLFYIDQKGPRKMMMGAVDSQLTRREKKSVDAQQGSSSTHTNNNPTDPTDESSQSSQSTTTTEDETVADTEYTPERTWRQKFLKTDNVNVPASAIPPNAMEIISPLAYRLKLSVRQQLTMHAAYIKVSGGNVKESKLSISTAYRQRCHGLDKRMTSIKENFIANRVPHLIVHWDGKKITYQKRKKKDERLAILGSFPGVMEDGEQKPDHFFGAPLVSDGTGAVCAQTVADTLSEWEIATSMIIGMCWDTTSSNTGRHKGAAVLFESRFVFRFLNGFIVNTSFLNLSVIWNLRDWLCTTSVSSNN